MADNDVEEILDDTENLLKKITHKICNILIGSSRKKMEKIYSNSNNIVHYGKRKSNSIDEEKNG